VNPLEGQERHYFYFDGEAIRQDCKQQALLALSKPGRYLFTVEGRGQACSLKRR